MSDRPQPTHEGSLAARIDRQKARPLAWQTVVKRAVVVAVAGVSIYLVFPTITEVFASWPRLSTLDPRWFALAVAAEIAHFTCTFALQRLALRTRAWFPVVTSQLAGNAITLIVPGGAAVGAAVQFRMLAASGRDTSSTVGGLAAFSLLGVGGLLALPVFALPVILVGAPTNRGLVNAAILGAVGFVVFAALGAVILAYDAPLRWCGRTVQRLRNSILRKRPPMTGLDESLLTQRNDIRAVLGAQWWQALLLSAGRLAFDYLCLLFALRATGARPRPSLILIAYAVAGVVGMIPATPGGLGLVEASLTGLLVLAEVNSSQAVLATLTYRLASYWLPLLAGPVAYGLFRIRYRTGPSPPQPAAAADVVLSPPGSGDCGAGGGQYRRRARRVSRVGAPERVSLEGNMKAVAVFPGTREVRLVEQDVPRLLEPDQVMLRMLDIGICGTDKEICSFEYGTPPPGDDHLVIGHESVAEVVQAGPAVQRLQPGDLVVPSVRRPCPDAECLACRSGHQDYCYTGDFTERGIKEAHGYMAEFVVDHERYLNVVPPDMREIAVLAEPLTIAEKALTQIFWMMRQRPPWLDPETPSEERGRGLSALVLGIGPVGLLSAMVLVTAGFTTYAYSRELPPSPRIDLVGAIGATYVSSQATAFAGLAEQIGNIDLIYEAVGHSHFALEALRVLGTNGIFVLTGVPGLEAFVEADPALLMRDMVLKNQVLLGTVNAGTDAFASALGNLDRFRRRWPAAVGTLIAGRYPPEQAPDLILGRPAGIKTVIAFDTP